MKQLAVVVVWVLVLSGCGVRVDPPVEDADSVETLRVFLDAVVAGDEKTGEQIAGECWWAVSKWFGGHPAAISRYEIPDDVTPRPTSPPEVLSSSVDFSYWDGHGEFHGHMMGRLRRDGGDLPWRVCQLAYEYAP